MKVTYFVPLLIMIRVSNSTPAPTAPTDAPSYAPTPCHERDEACICEGSGGFPDEYGQVCCRANCQKCDDHTNCGHNGGNPWCCSTTILHNHGHCTDHNAEAPCVRSEIRRESGVFVIGEEYIERETVQWRSTGFVVQLSGVIEYNGDYGTFLAAGSRVVGSLSLIEKGDYSFCPLEDQTFAVTNKFGLTVSIIVTKQCDIRVASWGLSVLYYDTRLEQFHYIPEFTASEVPDSVIISEAPDVNQDALPLIDIAKFSLASITFICQYIENVEMKEPEPPEENTVPAPVPEIILIYGLYILVLGLILWECRKCYINKKNVNNSQYGKVQVYLDESSQSTVE